MRVLVTGATGFAGQHLVRLLHKEGHGVTGWKRPRTDGSSIEQYCEVESVDLTDSIAVCNSSIDYAGYDWVFHLAAQTFVPTSFAAPLETLRANVEGTVNLLEALRISKADGLKKLVVSGSSEQYGLVHSDELPIREVNPFRPLSPYAVSKVAQEAVALQYSRSYGLPVTMARCFNYVGPGSSDRTAIASWCKQIALMERDGVEPGCRAELVVGNLDSSRDFVDVRDAVSAYLLLAEKGTVGKAYNVCTGSSVKMVHVVEELKLLSQIDFDVVVDSNLSRPSDVPVLQGCDDQMAALGWRAKIPFNTSLDDALMYWRRKVNSNGA